MSRSTALLLLVAALAWVVTVRSAARMGVMPGTMGLGLVAFLGAWTLMMAAMMLPSIVPMHRLYLMTVRDGYVRRSALLGSGYLAVWAGFGLVAFALAAGAEHLADRTPGLAHVVAVGSFVAAGIYQMTSLKDRCLARCRTPLGHLLRYRAMAGPFVDARVGVRHGGWCLACCWALMLLLVAFGVMNLVAMVILAVLVFIEKILQPHRWFSVAVGVAALALALAVALHAAWAPGLYKSHGSMQTMQGANGGR